MNAPAINTHGLICDFGKHRDVPYTRIPASYLRWMLASGHQQSAIARAELERRGTEIPELEISAHAIDRASLYCRKIWHETRGEGEGLHTWLARQAADALKVEPDSQGRHHLRGMIFAFGKDGDFPVLRTVMRRGKS